jgi:hypothetical protein
MTMRRGEQGYFLFIAVVMILIIGVMGSIIAYTNANRSMLSVSQQNGLKVFYNAESGLEIVTRYLSRPNFSSPARIGCASVTGYGQLTNASLNGGTFTATGSKVFAVDTLNGALTAAATTIPVVSSTGFAASGRLIIDGEAIDYAAISGNSFIGVTRGTGGTTASSHVSGAGVGQYQCSLDVQAGIPTIAAAVYERDLQWQVQLQDGYAVGARSGNNDTIVNWNRIAEVAWSDNSYAAGSTFRGALNGISMLSNADGWSVGDVANSSFIFLRWNGSAWTLTAQAGACSGQHLRGVSMVSANRGFAVGARYRPACASSGNFRYTIQYWNGSAWSLLTPSTSPSLPADASTNQNLNAVHVIDTNGDGLPNIGFAVGNSGTILRFNGTNWVTETSSITQDITGVYTVSASEAWAVGAGGRVWKWNGSIWSLFFTSPSTTALNAISMLDTDGDGVANFGLAVGGSSKVEQYNGTSWSESDLGSAAFNAVDIYDTQDAWLVGAGGVAYHWDGSSWTSVASATSVSLTGISLIHYGQPPTAAWRQVFN